MIYTIDLSTLFLSKNIYFFPFFHFIHLTIFGLCLLDYYESLYVFFIFLVILTAFRIWLMVRF